MRRQSETFIYHHGCVEAKTIPAELKERERVSEGQETERGNVEREMSKEVQVCFVCGYTVEGQD